MERGRRIEGGMEEERKGDKYLGRDKPHNISEIESRTGSWKLVISNKHEVAISALWHFMMCRILSGDSQGNTHMLHV